MIIDKTNKKRTKVLNSPVTNIIRVKDDDKNWIFNIDPKMVDDGELTITGLVVGGNWNIVISPVIIPTLHGGALTYHKTKVYRSFYDKSKVSLTKNSPIVKERFLEFGERTESLGCYPLIGVYGFDGNLILDYSSEADKEIFSSESYRVLSVDRKFAINDIQRFFDNNVKISRVYHNATVFSFRNKGILYFVIEHYDSQFIARHWDIYNSTGFVKSVTSEKLTEGAL